MVTSTPAVLPAPNPPVGRCSISSTSAIPSRSDQFGVLTRLGSVTSRRRRLRGGVVAGCGQPVQRRLEQVAVQLGDHEPAGKGAVAVVVTGCTRSPPRPGRPRCSTGPTRAGPPARPRPSRTSAAPPAAAVSRSSADQSATRHRWPWPPAPPPQRASCSLVTPAGARSAALTITRTCSTRNRPAANASRVAGYVSCNCRASHNPPEATSRGSAVNRISHAVVSVSAVSSATRRTSASAANASRHAATWDSNADSSAIASPSSCADSTPAGTACPSTTARRACATHADGLPGARSWVIVTCQFYPNVSLNTTQTARFTEACQPPLKSPRPARRGRSVGLAT